MITENLSTLKINKLTQKQYDRELKAGNIDETALYLTPDEGITAEQIGAVTHEELSTILDSLLISGDANIKMVALKPHEVVDGELVTSKCEFKDNYQYKYYRYHYEDKPGSIIRVKTHMMGTYAAIVFVDENGNIQTKLNPSGTVLNTVCECEFILPSGKGDIYVSFYKNNAAGMLDPVVYEIAGNFLQPDEIIIGRSIVYYNGEANIYDATSQYWNLFRYHYKDKPGTTVKIKTHIFNTAAVVLKQKNGNVIGKTSSSTSGNNSSYECEFVLPRGEGDIYVSLYLDNNDGMERPVVVELIREEFSTGGVDYEALEECLEESKAYTDDVFSGITSKHIGIENVNNLQLKSVVCEATPETLADLIASAQPNTTINLADGNYPLLTLTGKSYNGKAIIEGAANAVYFPSNLTISGSKKAIFEGIAITSGIKSSATPFSVDLSNTVLSNNLTIKGITVNDAISLKNASIDGLNIISCAITNNGINITPNRYIDSYGEDGTSGAVNRYSLQRTEAKNILIKSCTINGQNTYTKRAIFIQGCENIAIQGNTIDNGGTNGIQLTNHDQWSMNSGEIRISENKITQSSAASISLIGCKNADIHITKNTLSGSGSTTRRFITIQDCLDCNMSFQRRTADGQNTYDGEKITSSDGIVIENNVKYVKSDDFNTQFNAHKTDFINHKDNKNNPHNVTAPQIGIPDVNNLVVKNITYQATPSTLVSVIRNAQENATIQLAAGTYQLLTLTTKTHDGEQLSGSDNPLAVAHKKNLTIKGGTNVYMDGLSITSGVNTWDNRYNGDITNSEVAGGLKITNINFLRSFCLRNCGIDGLEISKCTFAEGAWVRIYPNTTSDIFGDDGASHRGTRYHFGGVYAKNVVVKNCTFANASGYYKPESSSGKASAIYLEGVNGATVHNNKIEEAFYNGIQIAGKTGSDYDSPIKGRIAITNNEIHNTGSRSIRMSSIEDANIYMAFNKLYDSDQIETENNDEYVKISACSANTDIRYKENTYSDKAISKGKGISQEINDALAEHMVDTENPHNVTAEQLNAVTYDGFANEVWSVFDETQFRRTLSRVTNESGDWIVVGSNLMKECWGNIYGSYRAEDKTVDIVLPFIIPEECEEEAFVQLTLINKKENQNLNGYYFTHSDGVTYLSVNIDEYLPKDTESSATISIYLTVIV